MTNENFTISGVRGEARDEAVKLFFDPLVSFYEVEWAKTLGDFVDGDFGSKKVQGGPVLIDDLENGTEYLFRVRALTPRGSGPDSAVVKVTPTPPPPARARFLGLFGCPHPPRPRPCFGLLPPLRPVWWGPTTMFRSRSSFWLAAKAARVDKPGTPAVAADRPPAARVQPEPTAAPRASSSVVARTAPMAERAVAVEVQMGRPVALGR
ncbi:MAG: fibronectin type III domain-containing protein [Acidobacteria bacterium]|nr:fibronectin type III domain-containing protein [Acidobacteriota bacterium]